MITLKQLNAIFEAAAPDVAPEPRKPKHYAFDVPLTRRVLCSWVIKGKKRRYVWNVPETHRTERRKRIEARWALRKREAAMEAQS